MDSLFQDVKKHNLSYFYCTFLVSSKSQDFRVLFYSNSQLFVTYFILSYDILLQVRGVAHNACNLAYSVHPKKWKLPILAHNLGKYDAKFLIQEIQDYHPDVHVIPCSMERFLCFSVGDVIFLDSYAFLASPLEDLVKDVLTDPKDWKHVYEATKGNARLNQIVKQKNVFPYTYFDGPHRFKEVDIPPIESFYDTLKNKHCTQEKYNFATEVWDIVGNFEEFHDLYLMVDVLILADIFEKFRSQCLKDYELDPIHYISLPSFAWDACLKFTKVEIELFDQEEMYTMIENNCRGGIVQCSQRYAEANNSYMKEGYDPSKESSFLMQYDANNLYALSLSGYLPLNGFRWITDEEKKEISTTNAILAMTETQPVGYIYEVSVEIPVELHDEFSDLPLLPEKIKIKKEMLSKFQQKYWPKMNEKGEERLTLNLFNKQKYVMHYLTLQFILEKGLKVTEYHRVLGFEQKPWMKPFIDFNTERRAKAAADKNTFLQKFYKDKNNIMFGKSVQNQRKHVNVHVVTNTKHAKKLIAKPTFKRSMIINKNLKLIETAIPKLVLNRPCFTGIVCKSFFQKFIIKSFIKRAVKKTYSESPHPPKCFSALRISINFLGEKNPSPKISLNF